jgi:hypothetical protein
MEVIMAVRTITRETANPRVILVWPEYVGKDDVKTNAAGNQYAKVNGMTVQPASIAADTFKAAFGFVPLSGSCCRYIIRKARAPQTVEDKLTAAIKGVVRSVLDED